MILRMVWRKIKFLFRRVESKYNARRTYDYPPTGEHWVKLGLIHINGFDNKNVFDPYVLYDGNQFVMYLSNRNGRDNIIRIESEDGINWYNPIIALEPDRRSTWQFIINRVSVIQINDEWIMYYTGQCNGKSCIGLATSQDGKQYSAMDKPILIPERKYELKSVMNPCVFFDDEKKRYKMIYSSGQIYEPDVLCEAESLDGYQWTKSSNNPIFTKGTDRYDIAKVGGCNYIKINEYEILFYIGYQNVSVARICFAVKNSKGEWIRYRNNPILSPTKDDWDKNAVYKPSVILDDKKKRILLWYNGRNELVERIGVAEIRLKDFMEQVKECVRGQYD